MDEFCYNLKFNVFLNVPVQPLRKNIESSFLADGEEMLKIRIDNMAEGALKSASELITSRRHAGVSVARDGDI